MKGKPKRPSRGLLKAAIGGLAVGAAAGLVMYWPKAKPAMDNAPVHTGTVVTPEGDGQCRRLVYSADASRVLESRTMRCDSIRGPRDDMPPVLRGYQDSLRGR